MIINSTWHKNNSFSAKHDNVNSITVLLSIHLIQTSVWTVTKCDRALLMFIGLRAHLSRSSVWAFWASISTFALIPVFVASNPTFEVFQTRETYNNVWQDRLRPGDMWTVSSPDHDAYKYKYSLCTWFSWPSIINRDEDTFLPIDNFEDICAPINYPSTPRKMSATLLHICCFIACCMTPETPVLPPTPQVTN